MVMHYNTKFGNKVLSGLDGIIWTTTEILTFTVTLTLDAVIQFFSQDTLVYDDVSSDQI